MNPAGKVPPLLDALVALHVAALPGWTVTDGPWDGNYDALAGDVVYVGSAGGNESESVQVTEEHLPGLSGRTAQRVEVFCDISSWSGDGAQKPLRDRLAGAVGAVAEAIQADNTLGGLCADARMNVSAWRAGAGNGNALVTVSYSVAARLLG